MISRILKRSARKTLIFSLCLCATLSPAIISRKAAADEARIAVASNFLKPARRLGAALAASGPHRVSFSFASTGKLFAQVMGGAPFDAFLAADAERPRELEQAGRALPATRFTYALGRLVLFSPLPSLVDGEGAILRKGNFRRLAMANPRLAPYGRAARQVLEKMGLWQSLQPRLVFGENIGQAFHFLRSGAAPLGLVARSQVAGMAGSRWLVPRHMHAPIAQQALLLRDNTAARAFLALLRSPEGRKIIAGHGYDLP